MLWVIVEFWINSDFKNYINLSYNITRKKDINKKLNANKDV
jgi:hypothetical protein